MPSLERCRHAVPIFFWAGLPLIAAAFLRLRGIGELEPFVDEGANILTALDPRVRAAFAPLEQGRPLLVWLFSPASLYPEGALSMARGMTAFAGLTSVAAVGWTLHMLAGRVAALLGMWIWAVLPIAVWHERLALQDPFVTASLAIALALMTAGSRPDTQKKGVWFAGAGLMLGTAFLLKISALLAAPWIGLVYIGVQQHFGRRWLDHRVAWLAGGAIAPVLMLGSGLLRLGSGLHRYNALPTLYGDVGSAAFERFKVCLGWYAGYGGWPLLLLLIAAVVIAIRPKLKLGLWCAAGWGVSLLVSSFVLNNVYGRYTLPDHLPLVLFLALTVGTVGAVKWQPLVTSVGISALAWWGWTALQIGSDPARANIPRAEVIQYVTGPWSGRGIKKVHRYLTDYADQHDALCVVLVHRNLRPGCYGLLLAQLGDPRVGVVPFTIYEPDELSVAFALVKRGATSNQSVTCFILYEGSIYPAQSWLDQPEAPTRLVLTIDRGGSETFSLYHVTR
jgi:hypothetical protein